MQVHKPRKIRDATDAARCLAHVEDSGLSLRDWAHDHGVDARSLNMWRVIRERSRRAPEPLRLVELLSAAPVVPEAVYRIRFDDLVVELVGNFDEAAVTKLIRSVRAC